MNFTAESLDENKKHVSRKVIALNPNAAEFVPSVFRCPNGNTIGVDSSRVDSTGSLGKRILGRSESSISNNSDDEAHHYWRRQLPDDITFDFKATKENEIPRPGKLSLAGLSMRNLVEPSRFSGSVAPETFGIWQDRSPMGTNNLNLNGNTAYSSFPYTEHRTPSSRIASSTNSWDRQFVNGDQRLTRGTEGQYNNGDSNAGFVNLLGNHAAIKDAAVDPLEFLSSQFPGVPLRSLADFYNANGCDLNSTVEMLCQLELQGRGDFSKNLNARSGSVPTLSRLDKQALPESHNRLLKYIRELHQVPHTYKSASSVFRDFTEFAPARKFSILDSILLKQETNGSVDGSIGSSRSAQFLASMYNGHGRYLQTDKSSCPVTSRATPLWPEAGEAVANTPSECREEALDLARLRDACLEQASQAFLTGNKALARELGDKWHLYNMQMKSKQLKAADTICRDRDPMSYELQGSSREWQDGVINLDGFHVSEALHVLKRELNILRRKARVSGQRLLATIFLGTGGKGTRISLRLPMAVEQFLLEEGLTYTQPQPGFLHVVIY